MNKKERGLLDNWKNFIFFTRQPSRVILINRCQEPIFITQLFEHKKFLDLIEFFVLLNKVEKKTLTYRSSFLTTVNKN